MDIGSLKFFFFLNHWKIIHIFNSKSLSHPVYFKNTSTGTIIQVGL